MSTWNDVINDAFYEIGAFSPSEVTIPAVDQQFAIRKLARIVDQWAARRIYAWATSFQAYTLTPSHSPTLIGPSLESPDFATVNGAPRPVRIASAELILTDSTPNVDVPIHIRDAAWWASQRVKALTSDIPTDLYYQPDFPSGSLYFWPVPNFAYGVRLELWTELAGIPIVNGLPNPTAAFSAPPGYEEMLVLTLAGKLYTPYGRPMPPEFPENLRRAIVAVQGNNNASPRTQSYDIGTRGKSTRDGYFNYYSGLPA